MTSHIIQSHFFCLLKYILHSVISPAWNVSPANDPGWH